MTTGTYSQRIREAGPRLSKSFKRLADYILDSYIQAALMTTSELAHEVDVDAATVVRFAQALGYAGFPELQDEIKARVLQDLHLGPKEEEAAESLAAKADETLESLADAIERTRRLLDPDAFEAMAAVIGSAGRVLILPDSAVRSLAARFAFQLQSLELQTGLLALDEESVAQALAAAREGELLLVIDMSGESAIIPAALAQARSFGLGAAAIVGGASFEAARRADTVLEVQYQEREEAGDVVLAALLEALVAALRWQSAERYKQHQAKVRKARKRLAAKS